MKTLTVLGIDPGKTGAIVTANRVGNDIWFDMHKMPLGAGRLREWFRDNVCPRPHYAYIEFVGGLFLPKNSGQKEIQAAMQRVSANLKLREELGRLEQVCVDHDVVVSKLVTPKSWQAWLCPALPKGAGASARRKQEVHSRVLSLVRMEEYGNFKKIPLYAADAFGICLYGMEHQKEWRK